MMWYNTIARVTSCMGCHYTLYYIIRCYRLISHYVVRSGTDGWGVRGAAPVRGGGYWPHGADQGTTRSGLDGLLSYFLICLVDWYSACISMLITRRWGNPLLSPHGQRSSALQASSDHAHCSVLPITLETEFLRHGIYIFKMLKLGIPLYQIPNFESNLF